MAISATDQPPPVVGQFPLMFPHPCCNHHKGPSKESNLPNKSTDWTTRSISSGRGKYDNLLMTIRRISYSVEPIPLKHPSYNKGVLRIPWIEDEVDRMNVIENLQLTSVGKFFNG
ncbi:hypothetical protein FXO38_22528 [Capsicum annuum]